MALDDETLDNSGKSYQNITNEIRKQNDLLREQVQTFRELENLAKQAAENIKKEYATRYSIYNVSRQIETILGKHANNIDEQVKGLRNINQILKDRNVIEDMIRKVRSEEIIAWNKSSELIKKIKDKRAEIRIEETKGALINTSRLNRLKRENEELGKQKEAFTKIHQSFDGFNVQLDHLLETLKAEEKIVTSIQKKLGIIPAAVEGIDKILRKQGLGRLADALNIKGAMDATRLQMVNSYLGTGGAGGGGKIPGGLKAAGMFAGNLGKNLGKALSSGTLLAAAVVAIVDGILDADKAQAELQKSLGISRSETREMRREFAAIANSSNEIFINVKGLQEANIDLNTALGTSAAFTGEILKDYTQITKQAGFSKEAALLLSRFGIAQSKSAKELLTTINKETETYRGRNGILLNTRKIVEEIKNISAGAAAAMGNQVSQMAKAVIEATALGTNIQQIERSASSLLEFESSISAELEAQLMTGRDINLNRAREYALVGDLAGVAKEVGQQIGSLADFQRMNVFQQEALAKAVGMTRDELAKIMMDREILLKIGAKEGQSLQDRWKELVEIHGIEKARTILGNKALSDQLQAVSNQQKWSAMGEKLLETFVQLGDVLMPIFNVLTELVTLIVNPLAEGIGMTFDIFREIGNEIDKAFGKTIDWSGVMKFIGGVIRYAIVAPMQLTVFLIDYLIRGIKSISYLFKALFASSGKGISENLNNAWNTITTPGNLAKATLNNMVRNPTIPMFADGGIVSRPTLGLIGEKGPEAIVPLNQYNGSNEELRQLNKNIEILIQVVKEGKNINMDSYKVGTALSLGNIKVQ